MVHDCQYEQQEAQQYRGWVIHSSSEGTKRITFGRMRKFHSCVFGNEVFSWASIDRRARSYAEMTEWVATGGAFPRSQLRTTSIATLQRKARSLALYLPCDLSLSSRKYRIILSLRVCKCCHRLDLSHVSGTDIFIWRNVVDRIFISSPIIC